MGSVVVSTPPLHGGSRGFEPHLDQFIFKLKKQKTKSTATTLALFAWRFFFFADEGMSAQVANIHLANIVQVRVRFYTVVDSMAIYRITSKLDPTVRVSFDTLPKNNLRKSTHPAGCNSLWNESRVWPMASWMCTIASTTLRAWQLPATRQRSCRLTRGRPRSQKSALQVCFLATSRC